MKQYATEVNNGLEEKTFTNYVYCQDAFGQVYKTKLSTALKNCYLPSKQPEQLTTMILCARKKNTQLFYYIDGEGNVYHTVCYLLGEYCPNIRGFTNEK